MGRLGWIVMKISVVELLFSGRGDDLVFMPFRGYLLPNHNILPRMEPLSLIISLIDRARQ